MSRQTRKKATKERRVATVFISLKSSLSSLATLEDFPLFAALQVKNEHEQDLSYRRARYIFYRLPSGEIVECYPIYY